MALHKMVNGIRIDLTPEEEAIVRAEWEKNREKDEERKRIKFEEYQKQSNLIISAMQKLLNLGLSEEEVKAVIGSRYLLGE